MVPHPRRDAIQSSRSEGKETSGQCRSDRQYSVKTTKTRGERGYDGDKKTKGRKRHLLVDTLGLIMCIVITAASVQDRDGAKLVFQQAADQQPQVETVWADSGYSGKLVGWTDDNCPWTLEVVRRPRDQVGFEVLPKRWIVERTFGWLNKFRLLSKEYEATLQSSKADIEIAMIQIMIRRLA